MTVDMSLVGEVAARLMDAVDAQGVEGQVSAAAIVVAINDGQQTRVTVLCSDQQPYQQRGLLADALDAVVQGSRPSYGEA